MKKDLAKLYAERLADLIKSGVVELSSGFCVPVHFPWLFPDEAIQNALIVEVLEKKIEEIREFLFRLNGLEKWVENDFQFEVEEVRDVKVEIEMHNLLTKDVCWKFEFVNSNDCSDLIKMRFCFFGYRVEDITEEGKRIFTAEEVEKAKKAFLKLIDLTKGAMLAGLKKCEKRIDFLNQPVNESGITRKQTIWKWEREFCHALSEAFVPKPNISGVRISVWQFELCEASSEEEFSWLEMKLHGINKLKNLIKQIDGVMNITVLFGLDEEYADIAKDTNFLVERKPTGEIIIKVPAFYLTEKGKKMIPFSKKFVSLKRTKLEDKTRDTKWLLKYLDELENFVKQYVLRLRIKRKQEKDKKLMI